jgi:hypothetical protein
MPRPAGSGKPKGYKAPQTQTKEAARELTRVLVTASLKPMLQAQIAHAIGIGHLYTRDKAGKFTKIEDEAEIDRLLAEGIQGEHYWIFMKDPSVQAFTDLMNRAIDKPREQEQEIRLTGEVHLIAMLLQGRQRAAKRLPPADEHLLNP